MEYFAIDMETTGLDPNTCQVLEVAAIFESGMLSAYYVGVTHELE